MEPLLFDEPQPSELDELVREIDRHLDTSFLADIAEVLERARDASEPLTA